MAKKIVVAVGKTKAQECIRYQNMVGMIIDNMAKKTTTHFDHNTC